jgi:hypothetical protein
LSDEKTIWLSDRRSKKPSLDLLNSLIHKSCSTGCQTKKQLRLEEVNDLCSAHQLLHENNSSNHPFAKLVEWNFFVSRNSMGEGVGHTFSISVEQILAELNDHFVAFDFKKMGTHLSSNSGGCQTHRKSFANRFATPLSTDARPVMTDFQSGRHDLDFL